MCLLLICRRVSFRLFMSYFRFVSPLRRSMIIIIVVEGLRYFLKYEFLRFLASELPPLQTRFKLYTCEHNNNLT